MKKILILLGSITLLSNTPMSFTIASSSYSQDNLNRNRNSRPVNRGRIERPNSENRSRSNSLKRILKNIKSSSNFSSKNRTHSASKYGTYTRFLRENINYLQNSKDINPVEVNFLKHSNSNWKDHKNTLNDWDKYSKKYYNILETGIVPENQEEQNKIINIAVLAQKSN